MTDKKKFFGGQSASKKTPGRDRFDKADEAMSKGGYAGENLAIAKVKAKRQPTSWSSSQEDRDLIDKLRRDFAIAGSNVTKSRVITLGLAALNEMSPDEKADLIERLGAKQD